MKKKILVAGATGNLGSKIVTALVKENADVRAIVRHGSDISTLSSMIADQDIAAPNVEVVTVDYQDKKQLREACSDISCVVSALSGLADVVIDQQKLLLDAAVETGVARFIPSDYSLDFTKLVPGTNRNLDLRRVFHEYLDKAPLRPTTIFNGAFMDLLSGQMPMIVKTFHQVLYWGSPDVKFDLTHTDDVAMYTAKVALDNDAPRYLHIAGASVSANDIRKIMTEVTGDRYKLFNAGSIARINKLIKVGKFFTGRSHDLYPAWQGMQYMRDMMEGKASRSVHDNDRYDDMVWTSIESFLIKNFTAAGVPA
ncbi:MAG: NAD-dependent epimerase/dehydratase family protein [Chitinophagaceae bacterium]|nr:MAG: NAD-dependent epimerase/dehydratase family protein [Chitinophagaceae bacterium]